MGKYPAYPEYKHSGVDWLGNVPLDWDCIKLKYVADLKGNKIESYSAKKYVGMENIESWSGRYIAKDDIKPEGVATAFLYDDVLFGKLRPYLAKSWLARFSGICSSEFLVLRGQKVSPKFLNYYLLTEEFIEQVDSSTYGSKMPRASWDFISLLDTPVPFDTESEKIANFLDHETAKIDTLIEKQQQLIKLLKEKRQAVISHAVTKGLNPDVPMRDSGIEWLREVPEHWISTEIRYITKQMGGGTPSKERPEFWSGDIPWVSPKDMKVDYISDAQDKITAQAIQESSTKLIPRGSVLIVVRGMILVHSVPVALTEREITINQDMKALLPANHVDGEFLLFFIKGLRDYILDLVEESAHGTKCLRSEEFERMKIAIPELQEQIEIVAKLKSKLGVIDRLIESAEYGIGLFRERRIALISAAVTGKIDLRNWQADSPKRKK